ncbi:MAG TPA: helix-turn-helix domain-containing protein [Candidatus Bathyarchaeia archaeon]|nr:helix-turn-helix domain-containing protein [Candidatus Bathyarchaeia archaeon]
MGVTHKLTQEIITFIVEYKAQHPNVGCRSLAVIVSEQFHKKISKSSINAVLKEKDLSSPVGRPGISDSEQLIFSKKFRLSADKKKELFSDASKQYILSDIKEVGENHLAKAMGNIFLKGADWELSSKPMLEDLMVEYSQGVDKKKVKDVAAVLPFLKHFHIESFEGLANYTGKELWTINNVSSPLTEADFDGVLESIKDRKEFLLKFSVKTPQFFTEVSGFRFFLKDGSLFFLDATAACIWKNIEKRFSSSLSKSMEDLGKMINNVQSVIVFSVSAKESSKKETNLSFFDFLEAFENVQSKRIQKIEILDEKEENLATFNEIPAIRRNFIAGIWPWDSIFHRFLETNNVLSEGKIVNEKIRRDLSYKEISVKQRDTKKPLRGILLFEPFASVPFVVLATNWETKEVAAPEIVTAYIQRWPNMEKGQAFKILSDPTEWKREVSTEKYDFEKAFMADFQSGRDPVWLASDQMGNALNHYAKRHFFTQEYWDADFLTMKHRFYDLSGSVSVEEGLMRVSLAPPEGFPYLPDLLYAVQQFNERGIASFSRERVEVSILK